MRAMTLRVTHLPQLVHPRAKLVSSVRECSGVPSRIFAAQIATLRAERGWSYEQLARRLDIAKQDAFRICNGGKASVEQLSLLVQEKEAA